MSAPESNHDASQLIDSSHDWKCPECGYPNHGEHDRCFDCGEERNPEPEAWQLAAMQADRLRELEEKERRLAIALAGKTGP